MLVLDLIINFALEFSDIWALENPRWKTRLECATLTQFY